MPASLAPASPPQATKSSIGDGLGADEAALEIGVDLAGRLGRLGAACDRPGARFLGAGGEEGDQAEQLVAGADDAGEAGLLEAEVGEEGVAVLGGKVAISASIAAEMTTAPAPSALRLLEHARADSALPSAASPSSTLQT